MWWLAVRYLDGMDARAQIQQLREELHAHNHRYYVLADPVISDREFDEKLRALAELEAQHPELDDPNSPTKRVGGDLTDKFDKVPHKTPMLSLSNSYNAENGAVGRACEVGIARREVEFVIELKYDGWPLRCGTKRVRWPKR